MKRLINFIRYQHTKVDKWFDRDVNMMFGDNVMQTNNYTLLLIFLIIFLIYLLIIS